MSAGCRSFFRFAICLLLGVHICHAWANIVTPMLRRYSTKCTCLYAMSVPVTYDMKQLFINRRDSKRSHIVAAPSGPPINNDIEAEQVRVLVSSVSPNGDFLPDRMLGVFSLADALMEAQQRDLDLVLINDKAHPPLCKIIDIGKYKYALQQKQKLAARKQASSSMKEITVSCKIGQHDLDVRLKNARKFIGEGHRVKLIVQFKGRENQHTEVGSVLLLKLAKQLDDISKVENIPKLDGRKMLMIIGPKRKQQQQSHRKTTSIATAPPLSLRKQPAETVATAKERQGLQQ